MVANKATVEERMLGKLSVALGETVDLNNVYDDIYFGTDEQKEKSKRKREEFIKSKLDKTLTS